MTTDNGSPDQTQPTAGQRLQKAREAAGLTVSEVADRQHLRPAVIVAIENGDYRQIDSELFLKGYVRAYASHVGIDPDSVVRQLDRELEPLREEQKAKVEENPLVTIERRKRRKRRIARIVAVLVLLAVVFYAGSLYLARQQAVAPDPAAGEEQDELPAQNGDPVSPGVEGVENEGGPADTATEAEARPEPDALSDPEALPDADGDEPLPEPEQPEVVSPDTSNSSASPTEPDSVVMTSSPDTSGDMEPSSDTDDAQEGQEVSALPEDQPGSSTIAGNDGQLVVEFSGDCWVEVQDGNGRTLVAELRSSGDTLEVSGESPLRVVLGAVSAVESVRYSGERVQLADRRARNNRLVLNLPE